MTALLGMSWGLAMHTQHTMTRASRGRCRWITAWIHEKGLWSGGVLNPERFKCGLVRSKEGHVAHRIHALSLSWDKRKALQWVVVQYMGMTRACTQDK